MTQYMNAYLSSLDGKQRAKLTRDSKRELRRAWSHRHTFRGRTAVEANVTMLRNLRSTKEGTMTRCTCQDISQNVFDCPMHGTMMRAAHEEQEKKNRRSIRTEDGVEVSEGDKVYGFHSQMKVGTIRPGSMGSEEREDAYHDRLMQGSVQPWFTVDFENGKSELLNGQRVCSVEHARRKGWI